MKFLKISPVWLPDGAGRSGTDAGPQKFRENQIDS